MPRLFRWFVFGLILCPAANTYELRGHLLPECPAVISLFGATTPFHAETQADAKGRFRFRALASGQYTIDIFVPGKGDIRQTVDLGPATADARGRLELTIPVEDAPRVSGEALAGNATVSTRELAIAESARHEYEEAQKKLGRRDVDGAIEHLNRAVAIAPQFAAAWNNLGTIAYQTRQYGKAEAYFRKALEQNPDSYEALVNLGGVLLNEDRPTEALSYNRSAVLSRPHDALANSQLGLNFFALHNLDSAEHYLEVAKRIDPAHFSYPQLTLARIHLLRNERDQAIQELRDFLRIHPDAPESARVRQDLSALERQAIAPALMSR